VHANTVHEEERINRMGKNRNLENSQGKKEGLCWGRCFPKEAAKIQRRDGELNVRGCA
jgi:hypothetical protein